MALFQSILVHFGKRDETSKPIPNKTLPHGFVPEINVWCFTGPAPILHRYRRSQTKIWSDSRNVKAFHYSYVIMSAMASQITNLSTACSNVCSGADQRKHQSSAPHDLCVENPAGVTGGFPTQRADNAKNASIWWRHQTVTLKSIPNFAQDDAMWTPQGHMRI